MLRWNHTFWEAIPPSKTIQGSLPTINHSTGILASLLKLAKTVSHFVKVLVVDCQKTEPLLLRVTTGLMKASLVDWWQFLVLLQPTPASVADMMKLPWPPIGPDLCVVDVIDDVSCLRYSNLENYQYIPPAWMWTVMLSCHHGRGM